MILQISFDRMQTVGRRSLGHAKECGLTVPMILQKPTAIFEGLTRDEDEDRRGYGWRCYCGIPEHSYNSGRPLENMRMKLQEYQNAAPEVLIAT